MGFLLAQMRFRGSGGTTLPRPSRSNVRLPIHDGGRRGRSLFPPPIQRTQEWKQPLPHEIERLWNAHQHSPIPMDARSTYTEFAIAVSAIDGSGLKLSDVR